MNMEKLDATIQYNSIFSIQFCFNNNLAVPLISLIMLKLNSNIALSSDTKLGMKYLNHVSDLGRALLMKVK